MDLQLLASWDQGLLGVQMPEVTFCQHIIVIRPLIRGIQGDFGVCQQVTCSSASSMAQCMHNLW